MNSQAAKAANASAHSGSPPRRRCRCSGKDAIATEDMEDS